MTFEGQPTLLFTENESDLRRLWGQPNASTYVKDGFHRYVIHGDADAVNPEQFGTRQHTIVQRLLRALRRKAAEQLVAQEPLGDTTTAAPWPRSVDGAGYVGPEPPTAPPSQHAAPIDMARGHLYFAANGDISTLERHGRLDLLPISNGKRRPISLAAGSLAPKCLPQPRLVVAVPPTTPSAD